MLTKQTARAQLKKTPIVLTSILLAVGAVTVGCSNSTSETTTVNDTTEGVVVEKPENGNGLEQEVILEITLEQEEFLKNLIDSKSDLETAQKEIEANNYTWRIGEQDGEQYAVTMDYRVDRLTLVVNNNIVTNATWG